MVRTWPQGDRARRTSGSLRTGGSALAAARLVALLLGLALPASEAAAQFGMDDWPGTKPLKQVEGPQLSWNGRDWQVPPGGALFWRITIVNDYFDPAILVSIQDDLPDPNDGKPLLPFDVMSDVRERPAGGTLSYNGDWLSLVESPLLLGESFDLRWLQTVDPAATPGTRICNLGWVSYVEADASGEPVASLPMRWRHRTVGADGVIAPVCVVVAGPAANLAESWKEVSDEDGDGFAEPGETLTYTITVRNTGGQQARSVEVRDVLPEGLVPLSASDGGLIAADSVSWDSVTTPALDRVRDVDRVVLEFTAVWQGCLAPGEELCNQAVLSSPDIEADVTTGDPAVGPGSATCLPTRRPLLADSPLAVSDASGDGEFRTGELVHWALEVTNTGEADAVDVVVDLPLEPWIVGVTPLDGGSFAGGVVTWTSAGTPVLARIAPGDSALVRVDGTVDPRTADEQVICSQASMRSLGCIDEPSAAAGAPVTPGPSCFAVVSSARLDALLTVTEEDGDGLFELGELVEYELTLRHDSGGTATEVAAALTLPTGSVLEGLEADEGGIVAGDNVIWTSGLTPELVTIGPGDAVFLHARGRLGCLVPDGEEFCANAQATGPNLAGPANAGPVCAPAARAVLADSALSATEADGDGVFELGELITLRLLVTNSGSVAARDATAVLPIPPDHLDAAPSDGGLVFADRIEWTPATTPALSLIDVGGSVELTVDLRLDPTATPGRSCRQAELGQATDPACDAELSDDASIPGPGNLTCYDLGGDLLPPAEVPDGDPASGGAVPVRLSCEGQDLRIEWDAAPRALTHHVYRGPIDSFAQRPWTNPAAAIDDPENAEVSCDLTRLDYLDEGGCARHGESIYILVIGRNLIGDGPVGEQSLGAGLLEPRVPVSSPCP